MNNFKIIIIALFIGLFSCVSTKVPQNEKKAKRKLSKHLKGVGNILKLHPDLSDTFTIVKYDTIVIEKHDVDTSFIMIRDTSIIDNLLMDFAATSKETESNRNRVKSRVRALRKEIIKEVLKDTTFIYEDSLVYSTFIIKDSKFYYKSTVKERKKPFKTKITNNIDTDCVVKNDFWQDFKFWILLLIILIISIIINKLK